MIQYKGKQVEQGNARRKRNDKWPEAPDAVACAHVMPNK